MKFLHIGQHKTGTTSFQQFLAQDKRNFCLEFYSGKFESIEPAFNSLQMSTRLSAQTEEKLFDAAQRFDVISSEGFCGTLDDIHRGGYLEYLPKLISKYFPDHTVLISVRDIKEMVVSKYVDDISYGRTYSLEFWLEQLHDRQWSAFWDFTRIREAYNSYFKNVYFIDLLEISKGNQLRNFASAISPRSDFSSSLSTHLSAKNLSPNYGFFLFQKHFFNRLFESKNSIGAHVGTFDCLKSYNFLRNSSFRNVGGLGLFSESASSVLRSSHNKLLDQHFSEMQSVQAEYIESHKYVF
jgi:hypothetical protein